MRKYHDTNEAFKYLCRSKTDKDTKKSFDQEVVRASNSIIHWFTNGDTLQTCEAKARGSYGTIITDMAFVELYKHLQKS